MFHRKTEVLTSDGWKQITKLKKGELIWNGTHYFSKLKELQKENRKREKHLVVYSDYLICELDTTQFLTEDDESPIFVPKTNIRGEIIPNFIADGSENLDCFKFREEKKVKVPLYNLHFPSPWRVFYVKYTENTGVMVLGTC